MHAIFDLEQVEINSVIDLGCGLGYLFEQVIKTFKPYRAMAFEPSLHAYELATKRIKKPEEVSKFKIKNIDLVTWAQTTKDSEKTYDLGICTSVFQYLKDEEIEFVLPVIAKKVKFLYFSCPTDVEFKRQITEYDFFDEYSIHRKREKYLKWLKPYFTVVSSRILESKLYFDDDSSNFKEQIFRF
jgi:SAM-dependent methyltransferase